MASKWTKEDTFIALFWIVLIGAVVGVLGWAGVAVVNQIEDQGACNAIDGEYVADLGKCVIDDKVVPVPGD